MKRTPPSGHAAVSPTPHADRPITETPAGRPHKSQELRKSGGKSTISKRRRQSVKDSNSALRLRGQLIQGKSGELLRREDDAERRRREFIKGR